MYIFYTCTVPRSRTRTVHLGCVYISYTQGCTTPRLRSRLFSTPYKAICSEKEFSYTCCTDLQSSINLDPNSALRLCVHKLYLPGRYRSAFYTRCTNPILFTVVHHTVHSNLYRTESSYTCCTDCRVPKVAPEQCT